MRPRPVQFLANGKQKKDKPRLKLQLKLSLQHRTQKAVFPHVSLIGIVAARLARCRNKICWYKIQESLKISAEHHHTRSYTVSNSMIGLFQPRRQSKWIRPDPSHARSSNHSSLPTEHRCASPTDRVFFQAWEWDVTCQHSPNLRDAAQNLWGRDAQGRLICLGTSDHCGRSWNIEPNQGKGK